MISGLQTLYGLQSALLNSVLFNQYFICSVSHTDDV